MSTNATEAVTLNGESYEVSKEMYHFIELYKLRNPDEAFGLHKIMNEYISFMNYLDAFEESKKEPTYKNEHLQTFALFHTIKPNTQYHPQQEHKEDKPVLYPVFKVLSNGWLKSMCAGTNYPIWECELYVRDNEGLYKLT